LALGEAGVTDGSDIRLAPTSTANWRFIAPNPGVDRFDHPEPSANHGLGASHGVEIPYIFGTIDRPETHPRIGDRPSRAVAAAVQGLWTSFIRGESPGWDPYTRPERTTALIADGIFAVGVFAVDDPAADERRVWRGRW
jgi:para-nitrobenzyl esterase